MVEIVGNFHLHTHHSDGTGSHEQVAEAAARAGLDLVWATDHNRRVAGKEGWYPHVPSGRQVLLLMGEEIHDTDRSPEVSHYLCLGADRELCHYARQPQALVDAVRRHGGLGFLAHPIERAAPLFDESALPWVDWEVTGFTGIELWNYMSEFKRYLSSKPAAALAALFPSLFIRGPLPETLALWDSLLGDGRQVIAIGGADAHAIRYGLGPLRRVVFPYEYLFRAVNTHLLLDAPLPQDLEAARAQVLDALRAGHAFVAYDLAGDSRGFRFTADATSGHVSMGDELRLDGPVTFNASCPLPADLRLLRDGQEVVRARGRTLTYVTHAPGVFRLEGHRRYRLKRRAWIFSNPIYIRE